MSDSGPWYDLLHRPELLLSRRRMLELTGASLALGGCVPGDDGDQPLVPGRLGDRAGGPLRHYASSTLVDGFAVGLRARCRDGRPLNIVGDPEHPASRGGCSIQTQAALLDLYDPARPDQPLQDGGVIPWSMIEQGLGRDRGTGAGLHLLLEPQSGPITCTLLDRLRERYPAMRVHAAAPPWQTAGVVASRQLFGRPLVPVPRLDQVDVLALFDDDPFCDGPWAMRAASDHARRRQAGERPRVHVVESHPRPGTSLCDHRLAVGAWQVREILQALVARLQERLPDTGEPVAPVPELDEPGRAFVDRLLEDCLWAGEAALILVGAQQPPAVHALGALANHLLGAVGRGLVYRHDPRDPLPGPGLADLAQALQAGVVEELVVVGGDPVQRCPGQLDLAGSFARAGKRWYLGDEQDATAALCDIFIPRRHLLEGWGDGRALDGSWSIRQPAVRPWREGMDECELLTALLGEPMPSRQVIRQGIADAVGPVAVTECLARGMVGIDSDPPLLPDPDVAAVADLLQEAATDFESGPVLELVLDPRLGDGRHAGNLWLQECPDPVSGQCWGNAALIAPSFARSRGLRTGDVVRLDHSDGSLTVPVQLLPGIASGSIVLSLGQGRQEGLAESCRVGTDAWPALPLDRPWRPVSLQATGERQELAIVQEHWELGASDVVQELTVAELAVKQGGSHREPHPPHSLRAHGYPAPRQWAMTIDLDVCTGCSSCVIACQAENNIPVVGPDLVRRSLEMHWLRVERYYRAADGGAVVAHLPMACQHCERAPCEYVCPTAATTHSPDGLNEMTYNRCVGTRFCANNCPYQVRRFNYYEYHASVTAERAMVYNPEVSVRSRGVMEKCTYCVQRIRRAEQDARAAGEPLDSGQIVTACEEVCPTQAIAFGDLEDPDSRVHAGRHGPRAYSALEESGAVPRTRYLKRVRYGGGGS